jgi:NAD(P)-dependent dehydrogenase (short-subunit alcohol dehydrogenase family)
MLFDLRGKVAVVTGASIGVGKGVALGLGEAGATVYVTGRRTEVNPDDWLPGSVTQVADEVTQLGGVGIPVRCDHRSDDEVEALFRRVTDEQGRVDILVNNIWGGYANMVEDGEFTWERPFWEQPHWRWDVLFDAGARAHFSASRLGARLMVAQRSGLIVNISFWAAQKHLGNAIYGASKAATDKLAKDMAFELREYNVAAVSLYPGLVRTEGVMKNAEFFDLSNSESPQFNGRAVAALAADPNVMQKSGQVLVSAQLALEYGFTDIDGKQPRPLTLEEV